MFKSKQSPYKSDFSIIRFLILDRWCTTVKLLIEKEMCNSIHSEKCKNKKQTVHT